MTRSRKNLSSNEKRNECSPILLGVGRPECEKVFVTAIRIASEVGVVLEKMDGAANSLFMKSILGTNQ
jgi:hypothetical protein